jgi:hypothetical protein
VAALAVGAALVVAGCSGPAGPDRAAVVDGQVISETSMQSGMAQVNAMEPKLLQAALTPTGTVTALVQAPVVLGYLSSKGVRISDSVATKAAARRGVADPSDTTLEIVKLAMAISQAQNDGKFTPDDQAALVSQLQALKVEVNPRYGTYDAETASVQLTAPGWVTAPTAAQ